MCFYITLMLDNMMILFFFIYLSFMTQIVFYYFTRYSGTLLLHILSLDTFCQNILSAFYWSRRQNWCRKPFSLLSLHWRHNGHDGVSNHQPHHCLHNRLFGRRIKKTPKLRVTGLCAGNSPGISEFPAQMVSNAEKCFHLMTSSC